MEFPSEDRLMDYSKNRRNFLDNLILAGHFAFCAALAADQYNYLQKQYETRQNVQQVRKLGPQYGNCFSISSYLNLNSLHNIGFPFNLSPGIAISAINQDCLERRTGKEDQD